MAAQTQAPAIPKKDIHEKIGQIQLVKDCRKSMENWLKSVKIGHKMAKNSCKMNESF